MDIFLYVVGIMVAVAALIAALVVTILCYLNYCSKHPMRKLRAEICVVAIACIFSLTIRLIIGFAYLPHDSFAGGV